MAGSHKRDTLFTMKDLFVLFHNAFFMSSTNAKKIVGI